MLPQLVAISAKTESSTVYRIVLSRALHSYAWKANRFTCRGPKQIEGFGLWTSPVLDFSLSLYLSLSTFKSEHSRLSIGYTVRSLMIGFLLL